MSPLANKERTLLRRPPQLRLIAMAAVISVTLLLMSVTAALADPPSESVYAGGQTYQINTRATVVLDAAQGLLETASPIYIIGFPVAAGTTGPITLPSGYQPQNNGLPSPIPYHDHVLLAAPGQPGYGAPLRVVQMRYTWAYAYSPSFVPLKSYSELVGGRSRREVRADQPGGRQSVRDLDDHRPHPPDRAIARNVEEQRRPNGTPLRFAVDAYLGVRQLGGCLRPDSGHASAT